MTDTIPGKPKKVYTLNALRGFSAIFVVFYHMVAYGKYLDPDYLPSSFKYFYNKGQFRVLIFFIISGTVISLSNKTGINSKNLLTYIKKRAIRIYPIYAASLLIALLVSETVNSPATIIGNFTFLDVLVTNVISGNGPVWTLHYEIVFYLLFIPVSMLDIDPLKVFLFSIFIGFLNFFLSPYLHTPIITSYFFGFTFWSLGLVIVKYFMVSKEPVQYTKLVGFLFLLISVPYLNVIKESLYKFSQVTLAHYKDFVFDGDINRWFKIAFSMQDFGYLPYCFMGVVLFSQRDFKYRKILFWLLQLLPAYTLCYIYKETGSVPVKKLIFPIGCYAMSWFLLFIDFPLLKLVSNRIIHFLIWMGGISYGTYIIHIPVLMLIHKVPFFSGTVFTFVIRMILYFLLTYSLAYFLENQYQQWILRLFQNKHAERLKNNIKQAWEYVVVKSKDTKSGSLY